MGKTISVSFRINPNVDAKTHPYISTGLKENKFGLSESELKEAVSLLKKLKNVKAIGLSCHIGSQILDIKPLEQAWNSMLNIAKKMPFQIKKLDLGGGLGIAYLKEKEPDLTKYAQTISKFYLKAQKSLGKQVRFGIEPGRSIIAKAGMLLSEVTVRKTRGAQTFIVLDAGMNDLIRPALYGATHKAIPLKLKTNKSKKSKTTYLVGPVCESSDVFEKSKQLPDLQEGDLIAFSNAGAYGMSMASQYNSRPIPAEVLVDKTNAKLIRKRQSLQSLIEDEINQEVLP